MKKLLTTLLFVALPAFADQTITNYHDYTPITVTSCDWAAGAICSMTWAGKEFIALRKGQFEVLTAYMPTEFSQFYTVSKSGNVSVLSDTPAGEQTLPIMFATSGGSHALGIYMPGLPQPEYPAAGYGRWRFPDCVKFNAVMRLANPSGVYRFTVYLVIGTQQEVSSTLFSLQTRFAK